MEAANAFDMLILPLIRCVVWSVVAFSILHAVQVGLGRLFGPTVPRPVSVVRRQPVRRPRAMTSVVSR